ncbi:MAG: type II toxin-antitoxin system VapC family toxin, partial [Candidatus Dormibacteraceae bacterium]
MIILDTSVLYALLDAGDGRHLEAVHWYESTDEEMATTPLVLAETDHLVINRAGRLAAQAFRRDASSGAYFVEWWSAAVHEATEVAERYGDLGVSLTDVSLVVLAARLDTLA